uniref:Uncharacterized protein n=1 Tax=Rhizophora mucronata TaxID=61149 RepID=A0A2P2Q096_RHIMU
MLICSSMLFEPTSFMCLAPKLQESFCGTFNMPKLPLPKSYLQTHDNICLPALFGPAQNTFS